MRGTLDREAERRAVDEDGGRLALAAACVLDHEIEVTFVAARGIGRNLQRDLLLHAVGCRGAVAGDLLVLGAVRALRPDLDGELTLAVLGLYLQLHLLAVGRALQAPLRSGDGAGLVILGRILRDVGAALARAALIVRVGPFGGLTLVLRGRGGAGDGPAVVRVAAQRSGAAAAVVDHHVGRARDDGPGAAAVLAGVVHPRERLAVDVDRRRALLDGEVVGAAAHRVDADVVLPGGRKLVDHDVRRTDHDGPDARVRAGRTTVCVGVDLAVVSETCGSWHETLLPR